MHLTRVRGARLGDYIKKKLKLLVQITRETHSLGKELILGEGLTYHTRQTQDTYLWYA